MNADKIDKEIEFCLKKYENIQKDHLLKIKNSKKIDFLAMTRERKQLFSGLKEKLETAMELNKESILNNIEKQFCLIRNLDKEISSEITVFRQKLQKGIGKLNHGKKAMDGYRQSETRSSPIVLSINR
jgi:penicillin-binding protein-related factor A (putative recombinase)